MLNRSRDRYRSVDNLTSVNTSSPLELVLLVYDHIAVKLTAAELALAANRQADAASAFAQAIDLISQGLLAPLDYAAGGEVAANLGALYDYCIRRLLQARLRKDPALVREVAGLLAEVREGWASLMPAGRAAPRLAVPH